MQAPVQARGFFGIGIEGPSKPMNFGNLSRTAFGFGASFVFTVSPNRHFKAPKSDTPNSQDNLPYYSWDDAAGMILPDGCRLVGIELTDDADTLASFRHPTRAAYVLGPERGALSPDMMERCEFIVKIPTRFCLNVATAGAIVMYDRMLSMGRFAERPVKIGGAPLPAPEHLDGKAQWQAGKRLPRAKGRNRQGKATS